MKNNKGKGLLGLLILVVAIGLFGFFAYDTLKNSGQSADASVAAVTPTQTDAAGESEDITAEGETEAGLESAETEAETQAETDETAAPSERKGIKLGLDLAGGVSITYQTVKPNPTAEEMSDTIYKLQQRVQNYSTEAEVYQEGDNRINIDIPGVSDANAVLEELGKPGSLVFYDPNFTQVLDGTMVTSAKAGITKDQTTGQDAYVVSLTFNAEGTKLFADATTQYVGQTIYIIYDGAIASAPTVREPITGGECQIDGMTSYEEAEKLASTIRIGSLSLELEELRSNVVGAKLGQEAIQTSLRAGLIGFGLVIIFMIAVYWVPGLAAALALIIYVAVTIVLLDAFDVTLTLPGIAGIVLSIGMAVDANVIIFTRIREEIGVGKTVRSAIKTGFAKALSAIIDGNITTLIAAAVLFFRGSGTVKGFATTLAIGIVVSMVTAIFVTRAVLYCLYDVGLSDAKFYGVKKERDPINFLGKKHICFALSALIIVAGFVGMGISQAGTGNPLNYSMEFTGGTSTSVTFNENLSLEQIDAQVTPVVLALEGVSQVQTQKVAGTNEVIIKTNSLNVDQRQAFEQAMVDNFGVDEGLITAESISAAVSKEMKQDAVVAVVIATILMLIYIWFRFKNIFFAASAVLALVHDVLVVLTFYALAKWSVGNTFIACMLTIVGYSINATIVIFDRIRENLAIIGKKQPLAEIVNRSITQTFTRSLNTSLTTFITIFVLFVLGVTSIREFALPLMVGIVFGTYSSVCVTGALWYLMTNWQQARKAKAREAEAQAKAQQTKVKKAKRGAATAK
ncbi:MAG: protein translocase subunit SecD [Lachnospiraceae bacterium]|jgi:SecD/SecF fusion protein|nr:protein translocase subunit SecD [Lachnospiraceae bacterium]